MGNGNCIDKDLEDPIRMCGKYLFIVVTIEFLWYVYLNIKTADLGEVTCDIQTGIIVISPLTIAIL